MSRKRFKKQPPSKRASNATESQDSGGVPEEILAEGSGPQEALEAADGNQREELESIAAEMAEKLVADLGTDAAIEVAVSGVESDAEAPEPKKNKKSRKRGARVATTDDDVPAELAAEASDETAELSADGETAEPVDAIEPTESVEFGDDTLSAATSTEGEHAAEMSVELVEMSGGEMVEVETEDGEGAELPTSAGAMDRNTVKQLIEALVFASDKPVTVQRLRQLTRISDVDLIETMLVEIQADYEQRGLILTSVSGGWQFRTRPQFSGWVQQLIAGRPVRLSRAQLETLAIVAYRQPITRPEIDDIRGVDSSATLKLLMDRQLIRILGKKEEAGRPMLYGTTKEFLDFFSLGDLRELPTLREYSELTDESRKVISDRLGVPLDTLGGSGGDGNNGSGGGGEGGSGDGGGFDPFGGEGGGEPGDSGDMPSSAHAAGESTDEVIEASSDETNETSIEANSDESDQTPVEASSESTDEVIEASSEESTETPIEASSDDSNETAVEASSDESTDEVIEASSDESDETPIEASSDESDETPIEASSDESNETAVEASSDESTDEVIEASSDESNETAVEASSDKSDEVIEASSDESTDEVIEASSDESNETAVEASSDKSDEVIEASSDESIETPVEAISDDSTETWVAANSDESDSLSALASRVLAKSDEQAAEDLDETFAAGHVRARVDAAQDDDSEFASGSQAFAAVSDDQVQAILAEGSESVLGEGLDVESMVGAMAATDEDAAAVDATDGGGDGMVASNELVSTDDIVDDLPEPSE